jgi:hypothetical protein
MQLFLRKEPGCVRRFGSDRLPCCHASRGNREAHTQKIFAYLSSTSRVFFLDGRATPPLEVNSHSATEYIAESLISSVTR